MKYPARTLMIGAAALSLALTAGTGCDRAYDEDDEAQGVRYQSRNPFAPATPDEPPLPVTEENEPVPPRAPVPITEAVQPAQNEDAPGAMRQGASAEDAPVGRSAGTITQPGTTPVVPPGDDNQTLSQARTQLDGIRADLEQAHGDLDRMGLQARQELRNRLDTLREQADSVAENLDEARGQQGSERGEALRTINESLRDLRRDVDDLTDETGG